MDDEKEMKRRTPDGWIGATRVVRRAWVAGLLGVAAIVSAGQASEPLPRLRILYAGDPGTERTLVFQAFLSEHFPSVKTLPVLQLPEANLSDVDVLIVDGEILDETGGHIHVLKGPQGMTLDKLSVPTILIGGMGGRISDDLRLKLGWRHG